MTSSPQTVSLLFFYQGKKPTLRCYLEQQLDLVFFSLTEYVEFKVKATPNDNSGLRKMKTKVIVNNEPIEKEYILNISDLSLEILRLTSSVTSLDKLTFKMSFNQGMFYVNLDADVEMATLIKAKLIVDQIASGIEHDIAEAI